MKVLKLSTLAVCVALGGCAATVQKGESTPAATPATAAASATPAPAAVAVRIPAASATRLVLNVSGSKVSAESKDWVDFKEEWRAIFHEQATAAGIKFEWQEGDVRPLGQAGTLLSVQVNDYRYVGIGARIMLGIMTGKTICGSLDPLAVRQLVRASKDKRPAMYRCGDARLDLTTRLYVEIIKMQVFVKHTSKTHQP